MGFVFATGHCIVCGNLFTFAPDFVPSVRVNGEKEPVCKSCVENANPIRKKNGLEPIRVHPNAYEPQEEGGMEYEN
jgi:hypothetical protein